MPLFINCGTTKNIEKHTLFVYRLYTSAILHLICNVFLCIEILVLTVFSGTIWWRIYGNTALWQTTDLIMAMHSSVQNRLFAKFADLAGGVVGKLSFKERDVSFFRIFDVCKS